MVGAMVGRTNAPCEARFRTANYRKCTCRIPRKNKGHDSRRALGVKFKAKRRLLRLLCGSRGRGRSWRHSGCRSRSHRRCRLCSRGRGRSWLGSRCGRCDGWSSCRRHRRSRCPSRSRLWRFANGRSRGFGVFRFHRFLDFFHDLGFSLFILRQGGRGHSFRLGISKERRGLAAVLVAAHEHCQKDGQGKKKDGQIDRELLQHVGGLRSPDLAGGGIAEGGAEAFLTWALHKHDENEQKADDDFDYGKNSNEDVHKRGANMGGVPSLARGSSSWAAGFAPLSRASQGIFPPFTVRLQTPHAF